MKTKQIFTLCLLVLIGFSTQSNKLNSLSSTRNTEFLERVIDKTKENLAKYFPGGYQAHLGSLPTSGKSASDPWSGSYWAYRHMGIAARYSKDNKNTVGTYSSSADDFVNPYSWCTSYNKYFQPADYNSHYGTTTFQDYVNKYYSPAEKYDLLVGDTDYTLTNYFKNYGRKYLAGCDVAGWMGICQGWATAAIYVSRPRNAVNVKAADGKTVITFLPDDIKGLVSQLYSNIDSYTTLFLGDRCEQSLCFSINPGTFVIAAGNQIGLQRKAMVFDQQSNAMIWNFPSTEYTMEFFNPDKKNGYTKNYSTVKVPRGAHNAASNATHVVGVKFTISYKKEVNSTHSSTAKPDKTGSDTYEFTIELDKDDNIVGGEWLYKARPEYVWRIDWSKGMYGTQDKNVSFNGSIQSLNNVTPFAKKASSNGEVLKAVTEWLAGMSA